MNYTQALVLGLIQGLTEFLPVSSSGHLLMARSLMNLEEIPLLFDIILHLATLIVVMIMFRATILSLLSSLGRWIGRCEAKENDRDNLKLIGVILLASFCTAGLGLFINSFNLEETPGVVFPLYIVTALILLFSRRAEGKRGYESLRLRDGIFTGVAQGLGVLPGISRSGITITAGLLRGMNRQRAAEYSFLISIPAILGALLLDLKDGGEAIAALIPPKVLFVAFLSAMLSGLLALTSLVRLVRSGKFYYFSFYLFPLGLLGIFLF